jgi:hypothetical protein
LWHFKEFVEPSVSSYVVGVRTQNDQQNLNLIRSSSHYCSWHVKLPFFLLIYKGTFEGFIFRSLHGITCKKIILLFPICFYRFRSLVRELIVCKQALSQLMRKNYSRNWLPNTSLYIWLNFILTQIMKLIRVFKNKIKKLI